MNSPRAPLAGIFLAFSLVSTNGMLHHDEHKDELIKEHMRQGHLTEADAREQYETDHFKITTASYFFSIATLGSLVWPMRRKTDPAEVISP